MTAAVAAGLFADLDAAARDMVILDRVVEPDRRNALIYDDLFARYARLYVALRDGRVVASAD
jgi:sugar (pentulose or hexulose) kinase